jgi:hypothetical protein
MDLGDKVFYSILTLIILTLVWLRFVEHLLSVWFVLPAAGAISVAIFNWERIRGAR